MMSSDRNGRKWDHIALEYGLPPTSPEEWESAMLSLCERVSASNTPDVELIKQSYWHIHLCADDVIRICDDELTRRRADKELADSKRIKAARFLHWKSTLLRPSENPYLLRPAHYDRPIECEYDRRYLLRPLGGRG